MNWFVKILLGLCVLIAVCAVVFGVLYATVPAVKDWTKNLFADSEAVTVDNTLPYEISSYSRNYWAIESYSGDETELILPSTFSFGPKVAKTYTFNDDMDIQSWSEKFEAYVSYENDPENPDWSMEHYEDEILDLTFVDANNVEYEVKSFMQILDVCSGAYPITVTYDEPTIIAGTDCKISMVNYLNDIVEIVNIPADLWYDYGDGSVYTDCINWKDLGASVKNVNIDNENPLSELRTVKDGYVIDIEKSRLVGIMQSKLLETGTELVFPAQVGEYEIKEVSNFPEYFYEVAPMLSNIEKVIYEEGIEIVSGADYLHYVGSENITIEFPSTMTQCAVSTSTFIIFNKYSEDGEFTSAGYYYDNADRTNATVIYKSVPRAVFDIEHSYSLGSDLVYDYLDRIFIYVDDSCYDAFLTDVELYNNIQSKIYKLSTM